MKIELNIEYHVHEEPETFTIEWRGVLIDNSTGEPRVIGIAENIKAAKEMAETDFEQLDPEEDICPEFYESPARRDDGIYRKVASFWV